MGKKSKYRRFLSFSDDLFYIGGKDPLKGLAGRLKTRNRLLRNKKATSIIYVFDDTHAQYQRKIRNSQP